MPAPSMPTGQSPLFLRSACEQCIECLGRLVAVHLDIDAATRGIAPTDPDCVYRLRKVLLHVKALTGWNLDTEVMHVMAPELRAASEQIEGLWEEATHALELEDLNEVASPTVRTAREFAKTRHALVSSYIHPTPQLLLLPTEQGGLGQANDERYYSTLLMLLGDVAFRYSISLAYLSQLLAAGKAEAIALVMHKIGEAFATVSSADSSAMS